MFVKKKTLAILTLTAILIFPVIQTFAFTSGQSAIGKVTIAGTCGLQFGSGNPINYGTLTPSATSTEQTLVLHNTGSVTGAVSVSGGNWLDVASTNQMNVGNTKFSTASVSYATKTALTTGDQPVGTVNVGTDLSTFWQLQVNLLSPTFSGALTQTMTFTAAC